MQEDWPTAQDDLRLANAIIRKHVELLQEGETLPMPRITLLTDSYPRYWTPDWMLELAHTFSDRYGLTKGDYVMQRVLTHYLLQGHTVH